MSSSCGNCIGSTTRGDSSGGNHSNMRSSVVWDTAQDNILIFQIIFLPYSSPWTGDSSAHHEGRRQTSWSRTEVRLAWQGAGIKYSYNYRYLTWPCRIFSFFWTATHNGLVWSLSGKSLFWHFWSKNQVSISCSTTQWVGAGSLWSCSQEGEGGGRSTLDRKRCQQRRSETVILNSNPFIKLKSWHHYNLNKFFSFQFRTRFLITLLHTDKTRYPWRGS